MATASTSGTERPVDPVALAHIATRLNAATEPPWLHGEVAKRMAERLPLIRQQPRRIVDWQTRLGASGDVLHSACPRATLVAVEAGTLRQPQRAPARWWPPSRWSSRVSGIAPDDVADASTDLLWCNMALHFEADIEALMQRWRRAIAVDGFLMFSTLGPGSLGGLRRVYRERAWPAPMAPLVDMHDLGDMLVHAGFAEPVMDQEILTLTWPTAAAMLAELRGLGGNADLARATGLRTPRWRAALEAACEALRDSEGRLRLEFELIYGHAFCAAPRVPLGAEASVSLEQMRTMVRERRRG